MDHTNYASWLPVHVRDMFQLPETHPDIYAEFMKGNFVVQKSAPKFSLITKDQSHKQSNNSFQAHGGAAELYENSDVLPLFMLAGQDCSRCVQEFETVLDSSSQSTARHVEANFLQVKYRKDALSFVDCVNELGKPFLATGQQLVALDTQEVVEQEAATSLSKICELGQAKQATRFWQSVSSL